MAQFCTKCGSPLAEGMRFCTGCGASFDQPSAPAAPGPAAQPPVVPVARPPAAAAPYPAPVVPAAAAPAASSGSSVVKIVLIVLAVLMLIGLLSAGACVYFIYRAKQRVTQFERQVQASMPLPAGTREGAPQPGAPAAAPSQPTAVIDTGVPAYPGATAVEGGAGMSLGVSGVRVQQFTTSDSVEKVAAFYKEKLGAKEVVTLNPGSAMVQGMASPGVVTTVTIAADSSSGKTTFTITSIGKQ